MRQTLITCKTRKHYPASAIGGKAQGLLKLKSLEQKLAAHFKGKHQGGVRIPPFFIVPVESGSLDTGLLLKHADDLHTDKFAVRSSSPYEDGIQHSFDGVFESCLSVERKGLLEAIEHVRASALGERARQYSRDFKVDIDDKMAVIVQAMAEGHTKGIIYSKFPASIEATKILSSTDGGDNEFSLIRRRLSKDGTPSTFGCHIIPGEGIQNERDLCNISYEIEQKFGYPVRVEYQIEWLNNKNVLLLLQARSVAGIKNIREISMPELEAGALIVGSNDVNGQGDYTLPAVVICNKSSKCELKNLPYETVRKLDRQFRKGYILICNYLEFFREDYDPVTPHKKAVVTGSSLGQHHCLDIAREKGLLYMGTKELGLELTHGEVQIKTGDMLRIVSDGTRGLLYRAK